MAHETKKIICITSPEYHDKYFEIESSMITILHKQVSGIYIITNSINNRIYIGSAVSLYNRYHTHKLDLVKNRHHSKKMQRFVNKYGIDKLRFSILEVCNKNILIEREQHHLDYFIPFFNTSKKAGSTLGVKASETLKSHFSKIRKGKQTTGMLGKKHKQSSIDLIRQKAKQRGITKEFMLASIKANTGRKHSQKEIRNRQLSQLKITPNQALNIVCDNINGVRQIDLAKKYNVSQRVISRVINGVGIYGDKDYYEAAMKRITFHQAQKRLF